MGCQALAHTMLGDSVPTTYLSGRTTLPLSFSAYRWAETYEDGVRLRDHIEGVSALTALIAGGIALGSARSCSVRCRGVAFH